MSREREHELGRVRLAEDDRAGPPQQPHDECVVAGDAIEEELRAARAADAGDVDVVL